jgi:glutaredoxin
MIAFVMVADCLSSLPMFLCRVARCRRRLLPILLLVLAWPGGVSAGTLYKSVTADGRVVYSDHPPEQARVVKTLTPDASPTTALPVSALEQLQRLKALKPAAPPPASSEVVLFTAAWCGYCQKAKAYLQAKGVSYREVDIDTPEGLQAFAQAGGGKGVPLLVANGRSVRGFSPPAYDELLARAK